MEMKFVHEERLSLKLFPSLEGARVISISVFHSALVDARAEIKLLLNVEKNGFIYYEIRTIEVGIPLNVYGEVFYVDNEPEVQVKDGIGEIFLNVKMRTEVPVD